MPEPLPALGRRGARMLTLAVVAVVVVTVVGAGCTATSPAPPTTRARYYSDFAHRYFDQGEAKGEARALLAILDARGIEVTDELRDRITACTDLEQLDTWVRRAATARTAQDLLD